MGARTSLILKPKWLYVIKHDLEESINKLKAERINMNQDDLTKVWQIEDDITVRAKILEEVEYTINNINFVT
jgi:hypothetical protein